MSYENLQLTEPNFVRVSGYFYHITEEADGLFKLTDDGNVAFSYPLDTDIQNPVSSIEYDGYYFWTLENPAVDDDIIIRKWEIEDFVAKQVRAYNLTGSTSKKYDSNAFAIEHFDRQFQSSASSTNTIIELGDTSRISAGNIMRLGPSSFPGDEGKSESITVLQTISGTHVEFTTPLVNSYNPDDPVSWATRCWFFNKYRPSDPEPGGSGQLYYFDIYNSIISPNAIDASNIYKNVYAASYLKDTADDRDYLVFMSQTNLLFIETEQTNPDFLDVVKSATQNNQETDTTVIPVYEITHENDTLFRMQLKATFRDGATESTEDWTTYNYQLSTLRRLPKSISLVATYGIITADGVSETPVTATVKDQFDDPISGRQVTFEDSDSAGSPEGEISPSVATTDSNGQTSGVKYRAGTIPKVVTITSST